MRETKADLGIIYGGRILKNSVIRVPALGTLNLHKRKVPEFRGGGSVGYWEFLEDAPGIGITVHYAQEGVDAGKVLAETTIPFESCETLESIEIKAMLVGVELYCQVISEFASGRRDAKPQDENHARTFRRDTELREDHLRRKLRRQMLKSMGLCRRLTDQFNSLRVSVQYAAVLPYLIRQRRRLKKEKRAPICILFYHAVANRPLNNLCIPLELFVAQIELILRYFPIISLDEVARPIRSGENSQVAFAITFDDGYRDNVWANEYLAFRGIPACSFVSTGHVLDNKPFAHDLDQGFNDALPMLPEQCRSLHNHPMSLGSHGVYHEDFGRLNEETIEWAMRRSRESLIEMTGEAPIHFSFPFGLRENISKHAVSVAEKHYDCYYSAYGGYCYPRTGEKHFPRFPNPVSLISLISLLDGYIGLKAVLSGDGWCKRSHVQPPY